MFVGSFSFLAFVAAILTLVVVETRNIVHGTKHTQNKLVNSADWECTVVY